MFESFKKKKIPKPIVLIVLDGWGIGEKDKGNAIENANLPTFDKLNSGYPCIAVQASGISVGLPWGEPGNSEVGHMALGAGKVIYQNLPRITMSIQDGSFFKNKIFLEAIQSAKLKDGAVHIMGLVGKGSVHSNIEQLYALLELMKEQKMRDVFIHIFTDGRDSPPTSGVESVRELMERMNTLGVGKVASISGRYFAMDRNNNWDRVKKAYDAMTQGIGNRIENPKQYLKESYKKEIFDEYIEPAVVFSGDIPVGLIKENDSLIFFNYREDRARQITKAFSMSDFSQFSVLEFKHLFFATMTQYEENLPVKVAFPLVEMKGGLGKVLSDNSLSQLRIAETEKFAHVTYFFNGGNEAPFKGEDRIIIPSKDVVSFDKAPEMSAKEITEKIVENIELDKYDFILLNFANADIVSHTGDEEATIKAVETIDYCLEKIIQSVLKKEGELLITADHGNAEEMINAQTGAKDTEHSSNPVPLWYVAKSNYSKAAEEEKIIQVYGLLSDIAPTILDIMQIEKPDDMTGESLLHVLNN